ncbi:CAP domain-containing protein [Mycolicibacterium stellerae]|uniref:CAP domain-containing protein n=1 Tax=Mycolicibacterium stellerae TaxID=2358193 RepID=UPI001F1BE38B|nr:CAP domain-containing protein [Mycolicibacterium stellerae]
MSLSVCAAVSVFGSMFAAVPAKADEPAGVDQGGAVLSQINATRAENGCGPVVANPQLTAAAARHANDVLETGTVGHTGSDGSSVAQRVTDAGYAPYAALGEIVFSGSGASGSPTAAVASWMNSPGHRAIITDCRFTEAGFSAVSSGDKMTAAGDFGRA